MKLVGRTARTARSAMAWDAYFVNSSVVVEPPSSIELTVSPSPSLVESTAVDGNFFEPLSTFTGGVKLFELCWFVNTALEPCT